MRRGIVAVETSRERAKEISMHWRDDRQAHPRVYKRAARAENFTVNIWVVVADLAPIQANVWGEL